MIEKFLNKKRDIIHKETGIRYNNITSIQHNRDSGSDINNIVCKNIGFIEGIMKRMSKYCIPPPREERIKNNPNQIEIIDLIGNSNNNIEDDITIIPYEEYIKNSNNKKKGSYICSICCQKRTNKANLNCGHEFCKRCIIKWKKIKNNCPVCRQ